MVFPGVLVGQRLHTHIIGTVSASTLFAEQEVFCSQAQWDHGAVDPVRQGGATAQGGVDNPQGPRLHLGGKSRGGSLEVGHPCPQRWLWSRMGS